MSYLERIQDCHQCDYDGFLEFVIEGEVFGLVSPTFTQQLLRWPDVFQCSEQKIILNPRLDSFDKRTEAVTIITEQLYQEGVIDTWVNEPYAVAHSFESSPKMAVERASASFFGIRCYGVHVNGLVQKADGIYIWIAVRARDRPFWPGKYDQIVAGGQGMGIGLMDNVIKESAEEANIPEALANKAQARGAIQYRTHSSRGVRADTLYNYDLWLPEDFTPENTDGEVDEFLLMPLSEMARITDTTDMFKANCNLVNIDLLIRSGLITDVHPDFKEIISLLYWEA